MSELVAGKCPNCGANVNLPSELETTFLHIVVVI